MTIYRIFLIIVVMGGSIWLLWNTLYKGLKTGKFNYGDNLKICHREKNPFRYWYLVTLFSGFLALIFAVVFTVFLEMWIG